LLSSRSLRYLGVDRIDLFQLHRVDPRVPLEDQVGELKKLRDEGKVRRIGLSEVSIADVEAASKIATIVSVQNLFNLSNRSAEPLLDYAERNSLGFIPWYPLATGRARQGQRPARRDREEHRVRHVAARPRVAPQAFSGHAADPWHLIDGAPADQRRRGRPRAHQRPVRSPERRGPRMNHAGTSCTARRAGACQRSPPSKPREMQVPTVSLA
jgi:hypothetical protein